MTDDDLRKMLNEATPGPWRWFADRDKPVDLTPDDDGYAYLPVPSFLADTSVAVTGDDEDRAANARLIAAAPDLAAEVLRLRRSLRIASFEATAPGAAWHAERSLLVRLWNEIDGEQEVADGVSIPDNDRLFWSLVARIREREAEAAACGEVRP